MNYECTYLLCHIKTVMDFDVIAKRWDYGPWSWKTKAPSRCEVVLYSLSWRFTSLPVHRPFCSHCEHVILGCLNYLKMKQVLSCYSIETYLNLISNFWMAWAYNACMQLLGIIWGRWHWNINMSTQHLLLYYYLFICFAFFLVLACGSICSMQWSGSRYLSRML